MILIKQRSTGKEEWGKGPGQGPHSLGMSLTLVLLNS